MVAEVFLHLLVSSTAEAAKLPVGVDVTVPDEARKGEPEFVVGNQFQTMSVLSEFVVGNTSNDVQDEQGEQNDDKDPTAANSGSVVTIATVTTAITTVTTIASRAGEFGGPFEVVEMSRLFGGGCGLQLTRILSLIADEFNVKHSLVLTTSELDEEA